VTATAPDFPPPGDPAREPVLAVDLDGTLLASDLLLESLVALVAKSPWTAFALPFWLLGGKAAFKEAIARRVTLAGDTLPWNRELLAWLHGERARGRRIVLATASNAALARAVTAPLGLFDEVLGSSAELNLKAGAKRDALAARFGARGFDYAGNDAADLAVWSAARRAIIVGANPELLRRAAACCDIEKAFDAPPARGWPWLRAMRPHQWVKNLLVFVPVLTAHLLADAGARANALVAFFALCLAASAVYIVNDLADLESDRRHPEKRARAFAAGRLPLAAGLAMAPLLFAAAALVSLRLGPDFIVAISAYLAIALAYTLWLKRVAVADVLVLAVLYTLRIAAGAAAIGVVVSHWLLAFSMFLFLSLALGKRHAELARLEARLTADARAAGRGYRAGDHYAVAIFGACSGYLAVLVFALYVTSADVRLLYRDPAILWAVPPLLLFWVTRVWLLAHRRELGEDPVLFAIRDPSSYVVGAGMLAAIYFAT
jgi:4-hydroxybenzoate polyprenyltransferase/phosphoserine phosphatase